MVGSFCHTPSPVESSDQLHMRPENLSRVRGDVVSICYCNNYRPHTYTLHACTHVTVPVCIFVCAVMCISVQSDFYHGSISLQQPQKGP